MGNASSVFGGAVQRTGLLSNGKGRALVRSSVYTLAGGYFSGELQSPMCKIRSPKFNKLSDRVKAQPTKPDLQRPTQKVPDTKFAQKRVKASCFNGCKGWCFQNPGCNSGCCPLFSEASTHHARKVYDGSVFALA